MGTMAGIPSYVTHTTWRIGRRCGTSQSFPTTQPEDYAGYERRELERYIEVQWRADEPLAAYLDRRRV